MKVIIIIIIIIQELGLLTRSETIDLSCQPFFYCFRVVGGKPAASAQFFSILIRLLEPEPSSSEAGETWVRNMTAEFCQKNIFSCSQGSFTCRKSTTWDRRLYFPSEEVVLRIFITLKIPSSSDGFELANLVVQWQALHHLTTEGI
jgi:hypothetical protein